MHDSDYMDWNVAGAGVGWERVRCNLCGADEPDLIYPETVTRRAAKLQTGPGAESTLAVPYPDASAYACTNLGYGLHPPIVRCRRCGLVYTNPRRPATEIQAAYAGVVDELYMAERDGRTLTFRRRLNSLETLAGAGAGRRLLDIGCYIGIFVELAVQRGWDAYGIEPSHWAVERARARGLQVVPGTLADACLPRESFDVVTLWDVVEHLVDPAAELRRVWDMLRPGGLAVIHTVDVDSVIARLMGSRWPWLMEMHLVYFSPATLAALLRRIGFEVIGHRREGRYLRLGYLASRIAPVSRRLAGLAGWMVTHFRLSAVPVPVNLGDLFTIYARRPPNAGAS